MTSPVRILALDGGGVRGISTLYILKELVAQVKRQRDFDNDDPCNTSKDSVIKPCQIFDLICGTSTGGLIALMLGRLEMTVDQAIEKYRQLAEAIFTSTSRDRTVKFDYAVLESYVKSVIKNSPLKLNENAPLKSNSTCKTFVVSTSLRAGSSAVRMRSYGTLTANAFEGSIWEAARATSAAPTFFQPILIDGVQYGDGGTGWNNPSEEAILEAITIWPNRPIGCLVSLGTGLEDAVHLRNQNDPTSLARSMFKLVTPGQSFQLDVAEYCVDVLTSCQKIHRKIDQHTAHFLPGGNYFRLNVPQSMSKIDLEEWKRINDMVALTKDYMENDGDARRKKVSIAQLLLINQSARNVILDATTIFEVPHLPNPAFTGRDSVLVQIDEFFTRQSQERVEATRSVALYGYGGIGKTQVAIAYAFESKAKKTYSAIFWASAISWQTFLYDYNTIAKQLSPNTTRSTDLEVTASAVKRELESESKLPSWLLIVDNADKYQYDKIKDLVPFRNPRGTVLLTTRSSAIAKTSCRDAFEFDVFSEKDATQFLLRVSHSKESDEEEALAVAKELGCLPLALEQAAAYVRETESSLSEYLTRYNSELGKGELLDRRPEQLPPAVAYYNKTVLTSFSISLDSVDSPRAVQLLTLLAFFSPNDIPEKMLQDGASGLSADDDILRSALSNLDEARTSLLSFSLVRRLQESSSLWMHVLLQDVVRHKLHRDQRAWAVRMIRVLSAAFPAPEDCERVESWPICRRYFQHVLLCHTYSTSYSIRSEQLARLMSSAAAYLSSIGLYSTAEPLAERAVEIWTVLEGDDGLNTAKAMRDLGECIFRQARYEEAQNIFIKARSVRERRLGPRHSLSAEILLNLALISIERSEWAIARELLELSISIFRELERKTDRELKGLASGLSQLGITYYKMPRNETSAQYPQLVEELIGEARKILETVGAKDHPDMARNLSYLAFMHDQEGQIESAIAELVEAHKIMSQTQLHAEIGHICERLRDIFYKQKAYSDALPYGTEAVYRFETSYGPCHVAHISALDELAEIYSQLGDHGTSERLYLRAIELTEDSAFSSVNVKANGQVNIEEWRARWLQSFYSHLAQIYELRKRFRESETAFKESLRHASLFTSGHFNIRQLELSSMLLRVYVLDCAIEKFHELALSVSKECRALDGAIMHLELFCDLVSKAYSAWPNFDPGHVLTAALKDLYSSIELTRSITEDKALRQRSLDKFKALLKEASKGWHSRWVNKFTQTLGGFRSWKG